MSTPTSRKESQAATRRRLVDAAATAFREHGFHRASAEAIAAAAGYTRGALYANYEGKDGMFLAVLDREIAARASALREVDGPEALAARYEELLDADPGWTLALLEFTVHAARHPDLAEELRRRNRALRATVADIIVRAEPSLSRAEAEAGARLVLAINTGVSLERSLDPRAAGVRELLVAYRAAADKS